MGQEWNPYDEEEGFKLGKWRNIFKKEFPQGWFLPLPKGLILTQSICDKYPLSIYTALRTQKNIELYSVESLTLELESGSQSFTLKPPPSLDTPIWTMEEVMAYILESWYGALETLEKKGKIPDLFFAFSKQEKEKEKGKGKGKGVTISFNKETRTYRVKVNASGKGGIQLPTTIWWNDGNLKLKVGHRFQQTTGTTYLTKEVQLPVPTKYIILTYINQLLGIREIEDLDYRVLTWLFSQTFFWLDANSMGERPVYGMQHPLDSASFQAEFSKGMFLTCDVKSDMNSNSYPLMYASKFNKSPIGMLNARDVIKQCHNKGIPALPEKNGGIHKSLTIGHKGVNNRYVGYNSLLKIYLNYLADPGKPEKQWGRIQAGTGGNYAEMKGMEKSNIHIKNIDGTITTQYGYPVNYFFCLGRGYGGNSGVVPVRRDFYIPYVVRKQFNSTVYVDNIPLGSDAENDIKQRAKKRNGSMVSALAEYIKECIEKQIIPELERNPGRTWRNEYLLTIFNEKEKVNEKVKRRKPLKVFHITGNNRDYFFEDGKINVDEMVMEGVDCVHINAEMMFKGRQGAPFKLRMLGAKATTLPCTFVMEKKQGDTFIPYEQDVDALFNNECIKGPAVWWLAYAHLNGPSYLHPNEGILELEDGRKINFLQPNNEINQWLEENCEEVFITYEVSNEVMNVLRQEPQLVQDLYAEYNPNADIEVLEDLGNGYLIREKVIGIYARIPLAFVEIASADEKVGSSTLTSQQFNDIGILNPKLLSGLVNTSSWKRDIVEKMILTYIQDASSNVSKQIVSGKSEQLFLPVLIHVKANLDKKKQDPNNFLIAIENISHALSSDTALMNLLNEVYPNGFLYSHKGVNLPISLDVLQIYSKRDSVSIDVLPITAQVLSLIRKLAWAFLTDFQEGLNLGKTPPWTNIRNVETTLDISKLNAAVGGWMKALLGDGNSTSKVLASLGRVTSCAQTTYKTSFLPSTSNLKVKWEDELLSIPVFYLHPDDDILYVLFGKDVPNTNDEESPYFIGCTRTPLGLWTFGRLIISEEYGIISHLVCNCVVVQQGHETDGDGDMTTIIDVTKHDPSITYKDISVYNTSYIGYLGYALHGHDSTLKGFFEGKSKWGEGKHVFRSKPHPLFPLKGYTQADFVAVVKEDYWANFAHYAERHYTVNVGTGYGAYSNVCFACSREVENFKELCKRHIPGVTNTDTISYLSNIKLLEGLEMDRKTKGMLVSTCRTTISYLMCLSLTCRILYEGMGLSGYKPKAFSIFSLYLALVNNPKGQVVAYIDPSFSKEYYLFLRASDTKNISEIPESWFLKWEEGRNKGEMRIFDGVRNLEAVLFPPEVIRICQGEGNYTPNDLIYDPITNSFDTYANAMYVGMIGEVIGILRKVALWGFIHSRMKRGSGDNHSGTGDDKLAAATYRVLRDFTSGSLGNDLESMMEYGHEASVSLYLWTQLQNPHMKKEIENLIPNSDLKEMVMKALPLLMMVIDYKQTQLPPPLM